MKHYYLDAENLTDSKYFRQIARLWITEFPETYTCAKDFYIDNGFVQLLLTPKGKKVIGTIYYFFATEKNLKIKTPLSENLRSQGVKPGDVYLCNVVIREKSRGKGLSKIMMEEGERFLIDKGKKYVLLSVKGDNRVAISLYNKLKYNVRRAFPGCFLMEKNLC